METWWFPTVSNHAQFYMDVSLNGGTPKSIHFNRVCPFVHYKTIHFGVPLFLETPTFIHRKQTARGFPGKPGPWWWELCGLGHLHDATLAADFFGEKNPWLFGGCTLRKFNSSPLKSYLPNRKVAFQPSFFSGYVKLWGGGNFGEVRSKSNPSYISGVGRLNVKTQCISKSVWVCIYKIWLGFASKLIDPAKMDG